MNPTHSMSMSSRSVCSHCDQKTLTLCVSTEEAFRYSIDVGQLSLEALRAQCTITVAMLAKCRNIDWSIWIHFQVYSTWPV